MTDSATRTHTVHGMTCDHCATSVTDEVGEIAGVEEVAVDLSSGRLEVRGPDGIDDEVKAAVEEAGYELAGAR